MENKMEELNIDQKFDLLNKIDNNISSKSEFSKDELIMLNEFSYDNDEDIRSEVAKLLVNFTDENGEIILLRLAKDTDDLVRIEACDSLSQSRSYKTLNFLLEVSKTDENDLARGYAINSIGEISLRLQNNNEIITYLENLLINEQDIFPRINTYKSLYVLGKKEYIVDLIKLLDTDIYQNRCTTVHSLEEILCNENARLIIESLKKRLAIEETVAVKSTINKVLSETLK